MKFTDGDKDKLLLMYNYDKIAGYGMGYEPLEADEVIITVEDIRNCIGKAPESYYSEDPGVCLRVLEDAWECLIDDVHDQLDTEDETKVYEHLKDKLKSLTKDSAKLKDVN